MRGFIVWGDHLASNKSLMHCDMIDQSHELAREQEASLSVGTEAVCDDAIRA